MCILYRVCDYIKYGWDNFLVDPDGGANIQNKMQASAIQNNSEDAVLFHSIPSIKDHLWTTELFKAPKVTYSTIYKFLVERKVLLQKASHIENIAERRDTSTLGSLSNGTSLEKESICYTRTLDRAYAFFQDGHVQKVRYHLMPSHPDYICIGSSVLPSMKKHRKYDVRIVLSVHNAHVKTAICVCPAGLSGCCNHVTATLYCVEEYFRLKLNEEEQKGCTEKLQTWNQPKPDKVDARPTNLVVLMKKVYGVEKRPKVCRINQWDCRPTPSRKPHPERKENLRKRLLRIEEIKIEAADHAVHTAVSDSSKRKATEENSMLLKYGTSCFLQLFDNESTPASSVNDRLQQNREQRIARAAAKKAKFQFELSFLVAAKDNDHTYCSVVPATSCEVYSAPSQPPQQHVIRNLYEEHVCVSPSEAANIEFMTKNQSQSDLWHDERKLRITASILKAVCHRKRETPLKPFISSKLISKPINSPAIKYGQQNENAAINSYVEFQENRGHQLSIHRCGLFINPAIPWLAATPDALVTFSQNNECLDLQDEGLQNEGCLEVKCPYLCSKKSIFEVALECQSFCLQNNDGNLLLKRSHQYFYQVQAQLYVTGLPWCDFVVWTPNKEIYVERIHYDQSFIEQAIAKARIFYFDLFLPSITPCMLICSDSSHTVDVMQKVEIHKKKIEAPIQPSLPTNECEECVIVDVSKVNRPSLPPSLLHQMHFARHKVNGDGNCLYHSIAHQAGFIKFDCHGDTYVAQQLRSLALNCMHKYPDVRLEEGITLAQWEKKKANILQPNEWGGDLEVRLLAIATGQDVIVVTESVNNFIYARRFPSCPPPAPKMRGGIFIPMEIAELLSQWEQYEPKPLLILYNGINHFDSTISL